MGEHISRRGGVRRALFGYRRDEIQQLLDDRDVLHRGAESQLLAAEARVEELESELARTRVGVDARDEQLCRMEEDLEALERVTAEETTKLLGHEVDAILEAARDTATRMVARSRSMSERDAERMAGGVRADVARLVAWREEALPAIRALESELRHVRTAIEGFADRLGASVAPLELLPMAGVANALRSLGGVDGPAPAALPAGNGAAQDEEPEEAGEPQVSGRGAAPKAPGTPPTTLRRHGGRGGRRASHPRR